MLIAVVSSKGSPGASSAALALALAWPRPVVLAELDPRGGDVLWGYGRGQNLGASGLLRLQLAGRRRSMAGAVWEEVVELPSASGSKWWLPGLLGPREAGSITWPAVARALTSLEEGVDVIADCGSAFGDREHQLPRAVWAAANLVALAVRPTLQGAHVARNAAELLRADLMATGMGVERLVSFVVQCSRGYPVDQVGAELADLAPTLKQWLPFDLDGADVLSGLRDQTRRFVKSSLMQAAGKLATELGSRAQELTPPRSQPAFLPPEPLTTQTSSSEASAPTTDADLGPFAGMAATPPVVVTPALPSPPPGRIRGPAPVIARPIPVPPEYAHRNQRTQPDGGSE